jgi:hypothetical protein
MENEKPIVDERPEWLKQLTEKSWNLELIISGAAIFMATYLPDAVDELLRFSLENLVVEEKINKIALPLLAYSFMKVVTWILISTFIIHFIMRAFWAGLVGLHAVYEQGIIYEKLPYQTDFTRQQMQERFGTLADYIKRLDRMANQIFAAAFMIALMSSGVGLAYLVLFSAFYIIPLVIGKPYGEWIGNAIFITIAIFAMMPAVVQLMTRNKKLSEKPWAKKFMAWIMKNAGSIIMPFVSRPMTYLNLTFSSNTSKSRMIMVTFLVSMLIMAAVISTFYNVIVHLRGIEGFTTRQYFAQGRNEHILTGGLYDNMRSPEERLPPVSLPSEVIEGPFLRVFIDYPKYLDENMVHFCSTPTLPDSMQKVEKRRIADSTHLSCASRFFQISINDSIVSKPDLLFHRHPITESAGWVTYLSTKTFQHGKNTLLIKIPSVHKPDSLHVYGQVPFWYGE